MKATQNPSQSRDTAILRWTLEETAELLAARGLAEWSIYCQHKVLLTAAFDAETVIPSVHVVYGIALQTRISGASRRIQVAALGTTAVQTISQWLTNDLSEAESLAPYALSEASRPTAAGLLESGKPTRHGFLEACGPAAYGLPKAGRPTADGGLAGPSSLTEQHVATVGRLVELAEAARLDLASGDPLLRPEGRAVVILETVATRHHEGEPRTACRDRSRLAFHVLDPRTGRRGFCGPGFPGPDAPPLPIGRRTADTARAALCLGETPVSAPDGDVPVVFAPGVSGMLLHEICGHLLEEDVAAHPGTPLRHGERVACPDLTVVDDPADPSSWAATHVDDVGNTARPVSLVTEGTVTGSLSAELRPGGHARRADYRFPPLPRMTTTVLHPGPHDPTVVIGDSSGGVFVHSIASAWCDPRSGRFTLHVDQARLIGRDGPGPPLQPFTLTGETTATLRTIDALCGDSGHVDARCAKQNQLVPVRTVGPTMRSNRMTSQPRPQK
ncbi:TldD/PmbA family protein [Sphaerisporangium corydalis]|uniref:TldD/PmbA family protein n=1 Tax=Sphaerisporangium corydalis TaxID=1441875 RepID=A0ABV9EGP6_9ACTN|nr:metallopeptidase TldD-related protein [Sphaerisporangium corydalis]